MKRREETQIMMDTLSELGIKSWPKLQTAIESGLKRIRAAKHQERVVEKQRRQCKKHFAQMAIEEKRSIEEPEVDE